MKKYDDNIPLLKNRVETHAFIRNISKHRLPDGTLDVEGNLKLWNDGMQGFVKTPLWEKTPGWREDTHLHINEICRISAESCQHWATIN